MFKNARDLKNFIKSFIKCLTWVWDLHCVKVPHPCETFGRNFGRIFGISSITIVFNFGIAIKHNDNNLGLDYMTRFSISKRRCANIQVFNEWLNVCIH